MRSVVPVVGYGTSVEVPEAYDELTRTLLRAAQRRGRALDLTVRYRRCPGPSAGWTSWELTADGGSVRIAAWARQLERELPIVAEGLTGAGAGRSAVRIARSFVARFIERCVGEKLGKVGEKVVLTRDDEARVFWPLLDPPDLGHELAARLTLADELLARWMVGDLPDETGVEEMQTAIEIVLRRLLSARSSPARAHATLTRSAAARPDMQPNMRPCREPRAGGGDVGVRGTGARTSR